MVTSDDEVEISNIRNKLQTEFMTKDLGELKYFVANGGCKESQGDLHLTEKDTLDLFKETRKLGCKPFNTPLERYWKHKISDDDPLVNKERYLHLVGKLIYFSLTRLDTAHSVSVISQFMHDPTKRHMRRQIRF